MHHSLNVRLRNWYGNDLLLWDTEYHADISMTFKLWSRILVANFWTIQMNISH